jgi:thioredoxin 1
MEERDMINHLEKEELFDEIISKGTVLVDFYADWCGPCRMLSPVIEEVAKEIPDLTVLKVNVDDMGRLANRFSIRSIPTIMLFKDGKPVATRVGFVPKPALVAFVKQ